ncbi:MAG: helix-turn-helix transcriptional regulator [Candidatus Eisenbacteria bacterium]
MEINKDLVAASATPLVLAILAEGESYGYAIQKRVGELSGGRLEWSDGMLYPVLHRLERLGYIAGKWQQAETGRRRRYYRLTAKGQKQLATERQQWQAVDAALRNVWSLEALGEAWTRITGGVWTGVSQPTVSSSPLVGVPPTPSHGG